ncbi:MAG: hypothetical protein IKL55_02665 [Clostridia bacterium]|nr:hypothetical protein [Clostridia bacterium]
MKMKKIFKTALIGIQESLREIMPLFLWFGSCFLCSLILILIFKEPVEESGCMFVVIAFLGVTIGTGVFSFVSRVKDAVDIMEKHDVDYKTAWHQAENLGEDYM